MEENEVVIQNTETDNTDEVLKSVSDDILKKQKRKTRIFCLVVCFLTLVLSVLVIIAGVVKTDTKPYFINEPLRFEIKTDGTTKMLENDDEKYDEFYNLYLDSFKLSYLTGLFTNSVGPYQIKETSTNFYSTYSNDVGTGMNTNLSNMVGNNYIHIHYLETQKMYNADGSAYYSKLYTREHELTYVDIYLPFSSNDSLSSTTFYFGTKKDESGTPKITTITVNANTSKLYNFAYDL